MADRGLGTRNAKPGTPYPELDAAARAARDAAAQIAALPADRKNACLLNLADRLMEQTERLLAANQRDLTAACQAGLSDAKLRRLELTPVAIQQMADGVRQVAELPDPVGRITTERVVPSGLRVRKVRCPLGVVMMIYEARPNVTVDAFALCLKAGNACILKSGREARCSNEALGAVAHEALASVSVPAAALSLLTTSDREQIKHLLSLHQYIDLVIPRGGAALIEFVHQHSRIPTVQHFHGVCHIYVDTAADLEQALQVCVTAKASAPATCNAVETVLVHQSVADGFVQRLVSEYRAAGVEVRGDERVCALAPDALPASSADWGREFLDLIVAVKVVPHVDAAIEHIHRYGSNHTDAILTRDDRTADAFTQRVQSSCVLVNVSTRFNDGFQLGLGAEIGISTSKIHAYGPMGLEELTAERYVVHGDGQTR